MKTTKNRGAKQIAGVRAWRDEDYKWVEHVAVLFDDGSLELLIRPLERKLALEIKRLRDDENGTEKRIQGQGWKMIEECPGCKKMTAQRDLYTGELVCYNAHACYDRGKALSGRINLGPCVRCLEHPTKEGHDACLGTTLPGLMNACCGHGEDKWAYAQLLDKTVIYGDDATVIIKILKKKAGTENIGVEK